MTQLFLLFRSAPAITLVHQNISSPFRGRGRRLCLVLPGLWRATGGQTEWPEADLAMSEALASEMQTPGDSFRRNPWHPSASLGASSLKPGSTDSVMRPPLTPVSDTFKRANSLDLLASGILKGIEVIWSCQESCYFENMYETAITGGKVILSPNFLNFNLI